MLEDLRRRVWQANLMLPKNNLVTMTSGNVSARDVETGLVVIKPSGVPYETMSPEDIVVVDLEGNVVEGDLKPSVDCPTHLYVYRHRPDVNGIVHTHSPYATAFAALGRPIPVCLTAIADEFGGPIPRPHCPVGERRSTGDIAHIYQSAIDEEPRSFYRGCYSEAAIGCGDGEDVAKTVHPRTC